jgi:phage anti-repressor protein
MNNSIIPIASRIIVGSTTETVHARKLHEFLGVGRVYQNWIKARIEQYGFSVNEDFIVCLPKRASKGRGGHNAVDHYITLGMAKELAMVERNEKGREARRYFIKCEAQLKTKLTDKANVQDTINEIDDHKKDRIQRVMMIMQDQQIIQTHIIDANAMVVNPADLAKMILCGEFLKMKNCPIL